MKDLTMSVNTNHYSVDYLFPDNKYLSDQEDKLIIRYHFAPLLSDEEIKNIWENEIPNEFFYESYYDTKDGDLFGKGVVVIHRRFPFDKEEGSNIWIVKIRYVQKTFSSKEEVERYLMVSIHDSDFCEIRVHRYRNQSWNYWLDFSLRIWEDLEKESICYVVASSENDNAAPATPSKVLFFFATENKKKFESFS